MLITLLLNLTAFSQSATDTSKIVLSYSVAKKVALDLIAYDSLKGQYNVTQNVLQLTEKQSSMKDSLIRTLSSKNETYASQILLYKEKEQQYIDYTKTLKKDVKKEKFKKHASIMVGIIALFGVALVLYSGH